MKQVRAVRPKQRRERAGAEIFPLDPRDPDIVRAKALARVPHKPTAKRA